MFPNPYSFQQYQNQQMGRIHQVFAQNTPLISKMNFENQNNMLHNNVSQRVLNEYVTEYGAMLDSYDRNRDAFQSPFNMRVTFGNKSYPEPKMERAYENVKYITLNSVILPRSLAIDTSHGPDLYPTGSLLAGTDVVQSSDIMTQLSNHSFLILDINEIGNSNIIGTSRKHQRDKITLYYDCDLGIDSGLWKPVHGTIVYPNSGLFNLEKMTLVLCDEYGNELQLYDELGNNLFGVQIDGKDYNTYVRDNMSLSSVKHTDRVTQVIYNFTIGVVENEISTETKFYK